MNGGGNASFLGRGWSFPLGFSTDGGAVKMSDREEDIRQSLTILLSTSPGERTMRPDYGCGLRRMVFETPTESIKAKIRDEIRRAVLLFEPRIDLSRIEFESNDEFEAKLLINLEYTIRSINARSNMVYPFYFIEGTDIRDRSDADSTGRKDQ